MDKSSKPLPQHLNDFLDWLDIEKGLSNKSQENYSRFLKKFLDWLKENKLDNLKPHQLSPSHIWQYRVFLARRSLSHTKEPLKKSTQNYYLIALRSFLNYFADRDIQSLPSEKIKLSKDKRDKSVHFLNLEQVEKLVSVPNVSRKNGLRDRTILEVFFSTGLRLSELVSLDKDQVNDSEISIVGKGGHVRTIYFSERAIDWLKKYLKTRLDNEKPLFINYRARRHASKRLSPRFIEKMIKKYALLAGLPKNTTPHVLRHSFATDLLTQGVDLRLIQEFLGHRNIVTTQVYTHVTSKHLRDIHRQFHGRKKLKK